MRSPLLLAVFLVGCTPAVRPVIVPPPATPTPIPVTPVPASTPSEGTVAVGAAGELYYHIVGASADTVLVPLGFFLDSALAPLGRAYTLVFFDPRKRGRSTSYTDSTLSTFAGDVEDIERVREKLGISKMALVGFSYFGAVTASYAAAHPDRVTRMAMISPIEPTDSLARLRNSKEAMARIDTVQARLLVRARAAGRDTSDVSGYCRAYWAVNAPVYVGETSHAKRVRNDFCSMPNEGVRAFGTHIARVMTSIGTQRDFRPIAARLQRPVLVMRGDRDLVANPDGARAWAAAFPDARLVTIRGGGHILFADDPEGAVRALAAFLAQRWPSDAEVIR